jgi:hypothetical protein
MPNVKRSLEDDVRWEGYERDERNEINVPFVHMSMIYGDIPCQASILRTADPLRLDAYTYMSQARRRSVDIRAREAR